MALFPLQYPINDDTLILVVSLPKDVHNHMPFYDFAFYLHKSFIIFCISSPNWA